MGNCFKRSTSDNSSLIRNDSPDSDQAIVHVDVPTSSVISSSEQGVVPRPSQRHAASNLEFLSEEEQIKRVKRLTLIQHLPTGIYDEDKKVRECVICMCDFEVGEVVRFLPCMHIYHRTCIDSWLLKSFTCPSCMEPVESALLATYETN